MPLLKSMHLAKFVAEMVSSFTLSLAVLKTFDWNDPRQLTPKKIIYLQMLFESIFFEYCDKVVWNIFTRVAITPELETLRDCMELFIKEHVLKSSKNMDKKFKLVRKALGNVEGVLM
ncbi:hypothetical protein ACFE04_029050 [Oxalis oulophora]